MMLRIAAPLGWLFALVLAAAPASAQTQPGSVGGEIGARNKSLSGDTEPRAPARQPTLDRRSAPAATPKETPREGTESNCAKIIGTWAWHLSLGNGETVFNPGGTGRGSLGLTFTWTCSKGIVIAHWSHGYTDRITISRDGSSLSIINNTGETFSATRK